MLSTTPRERAPYFFIIVLAAFRDFASLKISGASFHILEEDGTKPNVARTVVSDQVRSFLVVDLVSLYDVE